MPTTKEIESILTRQQYHLATDVAALINAAQQLVAVRKSAAVAVVQAHAMGNPSRAMLDLGDVLAMEGGTAELMAAKAQLETPILQHVPAGT